MTSIAEFEGMKAEALSGALLALWWDAKGDWAKAHEVAQEIEGVEGAWVHAYLHRKEGDVENAAYWYQQAGRKVARGDFRAEWEGIVMEMLGRQ